MRKVIEENERIKRDYLAFLKEAKGQDETSLDKVAAALLRFEEATGSKPFKAFHRDWASRYKAHLSKAKNARTGKPLGVATRDSELRVTKTFIEWLACQPGYKSRITYADAAYFNNNAREARMAHAQRPQRYPSMEQCAHAFRQMPTGTLVERRDRAAFALLMLTCARASALASLRLAHVDLIGDKIFQDGREVRTKGGATFETWFFPVDAMYRDAFAEWVRFLREDMLFGPTDAVFPRQKMAVKNGKFAPDGFDREPYANGQRMNGVIRATFMGAGMPPFTQHNFRRTMALFGDKVCKTMEDRKAWSQNMGHRHLSTTVSAYMPVSPERQAELIWAMRAPTSGT